MARVTRQALREADLTFTWKLVLRILAIIVALIATGLIIWAEVYNVVPSLETDDYNDEGYGGYDEYGPSSDDGFWLLPWEHISLGLSIIWNIANIGVWFTPSRSGRGMHPGANVGCDLILWLILLITGIFASFSAFEYLNSWGDYGNGGYDYGYGYGSSGETLSNGSHANFYPNGTEYIDPNPCAPFTDCDAAAGYNNGLHHKGVVVAVAVTFAFIVMLFHFALFISACRYTHARRHEKGGQYARAMTEEATALATKMVRDMGYQPPGQWQMQPVPQQQWVPQGQPPMMGAPMMLQQHYSMQPKSEGDPAERDLQERFQRDALEAEQERNLGKGKGKSVDPELGFDHSPIPVDYASSSQHPPSISIDAPSGKESK